MSSTRATPPGPRSSRDRGRPAGRGDEVPSITSAPEALEEDQARRASRYLIQMGIRVICFLGAIMVGDTWVRWALVVLAVVLPYSAVLFANAGRDRVSYDTSPVTAVAPAALPTPTVPDDVRAGAGRVVEHQDDEDADRTHDLPDGIPDVTDDDVTDDVNDRERNR